MPVGNCSHSVLIYQPMRSALNQILVTVSCELSRSNMQHRTAIWASDIINIWHSLWRTGARTLRDWRRQQHRGLSVTYELHSCQSTCRFQAQVLAGFNSASLQFCAKLLSSSRSISCHVECELSIHCKPRCIYCHLQLAFTMYRCHCIYMLSIDKMQRSTWEHALGKHMGTSASQWSGLHADTEQMANFWV